MEELAALAIFKSIRRNSPAFRSCRVWDLPTLHVSYPQTAAIIRALLPILSDAGLVR